MNKHILIILIIINATFSHKIRQFEINNTFFKKKTSVYSFKSHFCIWTRFVNWKLSSSHYLRIHFGDPPIKLIRLNYRQTILTVSISFGVACNEMDETKPKNTQNLLILMKKKTIPLFEYKAMLICI